MYHTMIGLLVVLQAHAQLASTTNQETPETDNISHALLSANKIIDRKLNDSSLVDNKSDKDCGEQEDCDTASKSNHVLEISSSDNSGTSGIHNDEIHRSRRSIGAHSGKDYSERGSDKRAFKFGKKWADTDSDDEEKRAFKFGKKSFDHENSEESQIEDKRAFKFGKRLESAEELELIKRAFKFGKKWSDIKSDIRTLKLGEGGGNNDDDLSDVDEEKRAFKFGKKSLTDDSSTEKRPSFRSGKKIWSSASKTKRRFKFGKKSVFFPDPISTEELGKRAFKFGKKSMKGPPGRFLYEIANDFEKNKEPQAEELSSSAVEEPGASLEEENVGEHDDDSLDLQDNTGDLIRSIQSQNKEDGKKDFKQGSQIEDNEAD